MNDIAKAVPRGVNLVDQVLASTIQTGDVVYFPNSGRKPEKVVSILTERVQDNDYISLFGEHVKWTVAPETTVRKVRPQ